MQSPKLSNDVVTDLTPPEISALEQCVRSVSPFWHVKTTRGPGPETDAEDVVWGYVFSGRPGDNMVPIVSLSRRTSGYVVILWDLMHHWAEGTYETECHRDLASAIEAMRTITQDLRDIILEETEEPECAGPRVAKDILVDRKIGSGSISPEGKRAAFAASIRQHARTRIGRQGRALVAPICGQHRSRRDTLEPS